MVLFLYYFKLKSDIHPWNAQTKPINPHLQS